MERVLLSVIVPMYNEEEVIPETYKRLKKVLDGLKETYEIIFINDGSRDKTREMLLEICEKDQTVKLIDLPVIRPPDCHNCRHGLCSRSMHGHN